MEQRPQTEKERKRETDKHGADFVGYMGFAFSEKSVQEKYQPCPLTSDSEKNKCICFPQNI